MNSLKLLCCVALVLGTLARAPAADELTEGFVNPPASAKPHTYWFWMNGNITRVGITADLESMQRVGIGGVNIFTGDVHVLPGKVPFLSAEYRDLMRFAANEAERLGLEITLHNCPGWSSSGGPWTTPDHAMQFLVSSETRASGPGRFAAKLPQPFTRLDYYKDIAVLAVPTPKCDLIPFKDYRPKVTSSAMTNDPSKLVDGSLDTVFTLPPPTAENPQFVEIELERPMTVRSMILTPVRWGQSFNGVIEVSDDGSTFREAGRFEYSRLAHHPQVVAIRGDRATGRFFRVTLNWSEKGSSVPLAELELCERPMIGDLHAKAGYDTERVRSQDVNHGDGTLALKPAEMLDLTDKLAADGALNWNVPEGEWTILRLGHTPTGRNCGPAPNGGVGPECDKFSREALIAHWAGMMQKHLDDLKPLVGKTVNCGHIDSYEAGGQNWTPRMREEFRHRRGYDMTPFLPVMTGRIVQSREVSERFLWDVRRTISDLMSDNYFGYFAELCHRQGMMMSVEPYGGPYESLQVGSTADIPMGEDMWEPTNETIRLAASLSHVYGRRLAGAEAFTANGRRGNWRNYPYSLKPLGDMLFTQGINRLTIHRYVHQPWMGRYPGMGMGQWGVNFERTNTWFEQSVEWIMYITRCQYLLQQGRCVADVAYFGGEGSPIDLKTGDPTVPAGFNWDAVNADVLMNHAKVENSRIVLDSGMGYAVLVLAPDDSLMRPPLLRKIKDLVSAGATVVGRKPRRSPSLENYPNCDREVKALADELWDSAKIGPAQSLDGILGQKGLKPDFECETPLSYIHRTMANAEVYFVSNQQDIYVQANCTFRVPGKRPELWHPDSGLIENAPVYSEKHGRTTVLIPLEPCGSVFVVFRRPAEGFHLAAAAAAKSPQATEVPPGYELSTTAEGQITLSAWRSGDYQFIGSDGKPVRVQASSLDPIEVRGSWELRFPPKWGAPSSLNLEKLISWTDHPEPGVKYFSGTATYLKDFEIPAEILGDARSVYLDLGDVKYLAEVKVNGKKLGILWKPPFRVKLDGVVQSGSNHLEVRITNLWPNRLIGDEQLPPDVQWRGLDLVRWPDFVLEGKPSPHGRYTFTTSPHWKKTMKPLQSGLLGPAKIWLVERVKLDPKTIFVERKLHE
jgi:hypothetical protein